MHRTAGGVNKKKRINKQIQNAMTFREHSHKTNSPMSKATVTVDQQFAVAVANGPQFPSFVKDAVEYCRGQLAPPGTWTALLSSPLFSL